MTLAIHRLLNTVQRSASQAAVGAAVTADKGRTVFYLSKASTVVNILRFSIESLCHISIVQLLTFALPILKI